MHPEREREITFLGIRGASGPEIFEHAGVRLKLYIYSDFLFVSVNTKVKKPVTS